MLVPMAIPNRKARSREVEHEASVKTWVSLFPLLLGSLNILMLYGGGGVGVGTGSSATAKHSDTC